MYTPRHIGFSVTAHNQAVSIQPVILAIAAHSNLYSRAGKLQPAVSLNSRTDALWGAVVVDAIALLAIAAHSSPYSRAGELQPALCTETAAWTGYRP